MNWLCPKCEGNNPSCKLCDGGSFITDAEMMLYLNSTGTTNHNDPKLVLDLSEFEENNL